MIAGALALWLSALALALALALATVPVARAHSPISQIESTGAEVNDLSADTIVVRMTPAAAATMRAALHGERRDARRPVHTGIQSLDMLLGMTRAVSIAPAFQLDEPTAAQRAAGLDRYYVIRYDPRQRPNTEALGMLLQRHRQVERAQPEAFARIMAVPDDAYFAEQWALRNRRQVDALRGGRVGTRRCDLHAPAAWDRTHGDSTVVIAVLDTGLDAGHPEFAGRVLPGYDFVNHDDDPDDDHGHGTACAGIIAAAGNNAAGIAGVAWGCRVLPVKVLDAQGRGSWQQVARGIVYAADHGARVLSMSFGGGTVSMLLNAAVDYAWARGCVMFAATGNRNIPFIYRPARHLHVAAVGALSPCRERKSNTSCDDEFWWGSNYGAGLDFLAPGVQIMTTDIRGAAGYGAQDYVAQFNGTSAATPHAAGVAALVLSIAPDLPNHVVLERLRMTCDDLGPEGADPETGYGSLNARNAVRFLRYDPRLALWEEDRTALELTAAVAGAAYGKVSRQVSTTIQKERREHPDRMASAGGIVVGFIGVSVIGLGIVAGTKQG